MPLLNSFGVQVFPFSTRPIRPDVRRVPLLRALLDILLELAALVFGLISLKLQKVRPDRRRVPLLGMLSERRDSRLACSMAQSIGALVHI